ncbi:MAG: leucine-rich repeat domain-containing protein, partial [Oscillospiraceae bacterium]|nr:leucine-rich repeat domain-containing protein [Oscillospiraceae bacterium]
TWNNEKIFDCKLQSVGANAFAYSGLRGIELPPKVSSMGSYTFKNCTNLGYLIFANHSTITKLPANMCENDTALYRVYLPNTLEEIGPNCFKNCTYNGAAESYVGAGKNGLAFYYTDTNLALNTSTYKVDKYVKVVDSSGNEADWGTAFQGVHAIFKVYPNNRLHVARLSTPKNIDGTYKNNNSSGSEEFVFQTGNDGAGNLQAGPQNLQAPVVGNKYKGDSTFKLTSDQDKYYDLLAVRCYDSTGYRMKTGDFFKANLGYYFEYDIYASPDHPIDLVFWGRQGYSCGGTTAQALPNTTSRSVYQGVKSISQASADKGQTITCYAVVHPCFYKNSSGSYVYPDAETRVNAKTLTRRYSLTVNKNGGSAGTANYSVYKLPAPTPEYGADYVNFEGHNIYEQSQYNSLRDYTVYYGCRKKGTTTITWYGFKPNGLLPDTTYELFYGSHVSGTKTMVCQLDDYTTPALMLVKTPTASIGSTISLSYKMNLTKSLTQKSGTYEPYIYMVQTDEATGSTIKTQSKLVPDCFYQTQSGNYGNLYNVPFAVAPINMNDPVTIKNLYRSTAGSKWNLAVNSASNRQNPREYTYTVMNYLNNVISNPGSYGAATVEMMKATKAYGISSQQLFQHNYDKVSTADRSFVSSYISGVTENDLLPYKAVVTKSATRPEGILGTSLVVDCKSNTALRVKIFFDEDVQPSKFTYTIDNKSTTLSYDAQNDYYYLELSGIAPANLDVSHNFRIVDNSTNTYYQVSASVLSYSYASVHNSGASAANKNLSKALYRYAKAADAVA